MNYTFECGEAATDPEMQSLLPPIAVYAEVQFKNLDKNKVFYKKQYRLGQKTRQLVVRDDYRWIHMEAWTNAQLLEIYGWVKRIETAARKMKDDNGEVSIKNGERLNLIKETDVSSVIEGKHVQAFSVDLHEIYDGNSPGKPVFELSKSDKEHKLNMFQLVIQLRFIDGSLSEKFLSPAFNLRSLETKPGPKSAKRSRQEDENVGETGSSGVSDDSGTFDESVTKSRQKQILVDMLDAKTARIEKLVAKNADINVGSGGAFHVETTQADLAYYLALKDKYDDLEEGDIMGFYKDEESGETYIQRLRSNNVRNALHAGVVSRSHWLAGHKPLDPSKEADTICVIGIVNVKVVGSIENGERIYASTDSPGKAIPQSYLPVGSFLRKKHVLLGMALETKKNTKKLDVVHLVKCFVCIVLDVSRKELLEEIEEMYEKNEKRTEEQIRINNKKTWRQLRGCAVSSIIMIGVITFILYQWLVSGSMFRYWLCRQGSIPYHNLYYRHQDKSTYYYVHGIEFTWQGLQDKVGFYFMRNKEFDERPIFYYLNVDRCAYYWAYGPAGNNIGGHKYLGGARILSTDKNCSSIFELKEGHDRWYPANRSETSRCRRTPRM